MQNANCSRNCGSRRTGRGNDGSAKSPSGKSGDFSLPWKAPTTKTRFPHSHRPGDCYTFSESNPERSFPPPPSHPPLQAHPSIGKVKSCLSTLSAEGGWGADGVSRGGDRPFWAFAGEGARATRVKAEDTWRLNRSGEPLRHRKAQDRPAHSSPDSSQINFICLGAALVIRTRSTRRSAESDYCAGTCILRRIALAARLLRCTNRPDFL